MFGIDDALIGSLGGAAISGLFGLGSAASSARGVEEMNRWNAAEAQRNRDWQERMSSTAHQREVADLRAAGLNPILSATGGSGASSPGGSMAVAHSTQSQASLIKSQMANLAAQTAKTIMESKVASENVNTQKTQQVLNVSNAKAAEAAAGGKIGYGSTSVPLSAIGSALKSLWTNAKLGARNLYERAKSC